MGFTFASDKNVFSQLVSAGKCDNVWSMCMYEGNKSNGTLTIGGADERLSDGPVQYVPDSGQGFHSVSVESLTLEGGSGGGASATIKVGASAILDTGTNVLLVGSAIRDSLGKAMCQNKGLSQCDALWASGGGCVTMTDSQIDAYVVVSLLFSLLCLASANTTTSTGTLT